MPTDLWLVRVSQILIKETVTPLRGAIQSDYWVNILIKVQNQIIMGKCSNYLPAGESQKMIPCSCSRTDDECCLSVFCGRIVFWILLDFFPM